MRAWGASQRRGQRWGRRRCSAPLAGTSAAPCPALQGTHQQAFKTNHVNDATTHCGVDVRAEMNMCTGGGVGGGRQRPSYPLLAAWSALAALHCRDGVRTPGADTDVLTMPKSNIKGQHATWKRRFGGGHSVLCSSTICERSLRRCRRLCSHPPNYTPPLWAPSLSLHLLAVRGRVDWAVRAARTSVVRCSPGRAVFCRRCVHVKPSCVTPAACRWRWRWPGRPRAERLTPGRPASIFMCSLTAPVRQSAGLPARSSDEPT